MSSDTRLNYPVFRPFPHECDLIMVRVWGHGCSPFLVLLCYSQAWSFTPKPSIRARLGIAAHLCEEVAASSGRRGEGLRASMAQEEEDAGLARRRGGDSLAQVLLHINVHRLRGVLVFKAHGRLEYSTLGLRVIKQKKTLCLSTPGPSHLNIKTFLKILATFGGECPQHGSKNRLTAPRTDAG